MLAHGPVSTVERGRQGDQGCPYAKLSCVGCSSLVPFGRVLWASSPPHPVPHLFFSSRLLNECLLTRWKCFRAGENLGGYKQCEWKGWSPTSQFKEFVNNCSEPQRGKTSCPTLDPSHSCSHSRESSNIVVMLKITAWKYDLRDFLIQGPPVGWPLPHPGRLGQNCGKTPNCLYSKHHRNGDQWADLHIRLSGLANITHMLQTWSHSWKVCGVVISIAIAGKMKVLHFLGKKFTFKIRFPSSS